MIRVEIEHRGQRLTFVPFNVREAGTEPLLVSVSDWYERASLPQAGSDGESPSASIQLDNAGGRARSIMPHALNAAVTVRRGDDVLLTGTCVTVQHGPIIEMRVEV